MKTLVVLAFLASLGAADAELDRAKAEFKKALGEMHAKSIGEAAQRLADTDQKAAVDLLLEGYSTLATQTKKHWDEKVKWIREKEATADFKVDTRTSPPTIPASDVKKYEAFLVAEKASRDVEWTLMNIDSAKRGIVFALGRFKSDASVKELLKDLSSGSPWQRRAGIAEALGQMSHSDIPAALCEAIKKDAEPQVKIAAMDALRDQKAKTPEVASTLAEQLKSDLWQVKATAAGTIKALGLRDAGDALVDALAKAEGRLKTELNDALVALTGVDKHGDASGWRAWWDANKDALLKGTFTAKPGEGADPPKNMTTTTFYGIPVTSKNVIFILDRSGSMTEASEWEIPKDVASGGPPSAPDVKKEGNRKIDVARWQLKRTLAQMPDGTEFNIIFFSHGVNILSKEMMKLSAGTRKQAFEWIDRLEAIGGTNTYDALEKALSYSTTGPMGEKLAKGGVDTIFLLTDGMPNFGQVPNAEDILTKIRELNRTKKVKIHTVGIFSSAAIAAKSGEKDEAEEGGKFLKRLAADSNGTYMCAGSNGKAGGAMKDPAGAKKKP